MNKVIAINLNGKACQLEESGYEALRAYLDGAARRLEGNPDRDEIISDIEQAIADKCRAILGAHKSVVLAKEIVQIIEEMGPVLDLSEEGEASSGAPAGTPAGGRTGTRSEAGGAESQSANPVRRLYKIPNGRWSPGVCTGLAAYFNIDVSLVRLVFILTSLFWGIGFAAYVALLFILPTANTPAEKAAAQGPPPTAQDFIRRAKEGYYEGMKAFADKRAHREWRRRFRREMRSWSRTFRNEMRGPACGWPPGCGPGEGAWFVLPIVSALRKILALVWIFAMVSLLSSGAVFGIPLPWGIPVWAGVLCLFVLHGLLVSPLKAVRRACYWSAARGPFYAPPFLYFLDALIGIGFVVVLLWGVVHHLPQIHDAIRNVPSVIHEAVAAVESWWARR